MNCIMTGFAPLMLAPVLISTSVSGEPSQAVPILEISAAQQRCILGEPLMLRLVLANKSSEKMPRYFLSDEAFADMDLILTFRASGEGTIFEVQIPGRSRAPVFPIEMRPPIEPGESWQCEKMIVPMYLLNDAYTILPAGRYSLSAKVFIPDRKPTGLSDSSNTVELQIVNPTGDDQKARAMLGPSGMAAFFLGEEGGKPKEIERLLAEYPQSTYARYAQARLLLDRAKCLLGMRGSFSDSDRQESRAIVAEARAYIQRYPDMALNDNILLWCARLQYTAGEKGESARTFQELFSDYPQSEVIPTARKHVLDWQRSHKAFQSIRFPSPQTSEATSAPTLGSGGPALTTRPSQATGWIRVPTTAPSQPASRPASEHPR